MSVNIFGDGTQIINSASAQLGNIAVRTFTRTLGNILNDAVNICQVTINHGACIVDLNVVQSETNNSICKTYRIPIQYNSTSGGWRRVASLNGTGGYNGNDFEVDVSSGTGTATLRLVRTLVGPSPSGANITCSLQISQSSANVVTIVDTSTATSGVTNTGLYAYTPISCINENVGIGTSNPVSKCHIYGNASVQGSLIVQGTTNSNIGQYFYPPAAMSANTSTITSSNATYGFGQYIASASSTYGSSYAAWKAFDYGIGGNTWLANSKNYSLDGTYTGTASTNGYLGEWLQLQLPRPIEAVNFDLYFHPWTQSSFDNYINSFKIFGSLDGVTWTELFSTTNANHYQFTLATYTATTSGLYSIYRFAFNNISGSYGYAAIGTCTLYANVNTRLIASDVVVTNTYFGVGTIAPQAKLHLVQSDDTITPLRIDDQTSDTTPFVVDVNGNTGIGTSNPLFKVHVIGKAHADTQILGTSNDSATIPSFSFKEDSNTGMFHPSTLNTLGFATAGTERMRILADGSVGIGTTAPADQLHVVGSIRHTSNLTFTSTSYTAPWFQGFAPNSFGINMALGAGGQTYIGGGESAAAILVAESNVTDEQLVLSSDSSGSNIAVRVVTGLQSSYANKVEAVTVLGNGNVGILNTAPTVACDVTGSVRASSQLISTVSMGTAPLAVTSSNLVTNLNADFLDGQTGAYYLNPVNLSAAVAVNKGGTGQTTLGSSKLMVGNGTNAVLTPTNLHWDSNNNRLGIGTALPGQTLHVVGDTRIQGNLTVNGTTTVVDTNTSTTEQLSITNDGTGPAVIVNQTGAQPIMRLQDDGVTVFELADGGNLGLGTTAPNEKLDVMAKGRFMTSGVTDSLILQNTDSNSGARANILFLTSSNSTQYELGTRNTLGNPNNAFYLYAKNIGGTAVNAYRMVIDESGNMGLGGVTAPSARLHVSGTSRFTDSMRFSKNTFNHLTIEEETGSDNVSIMFRTQNSNSDLICGKIMFDGYTDGTRASSIHLYGGCNATLNHGLTVDPFGNLGVGTTAPGQKLDVTGSIRASSQLISTVPMGTAPLAVTSSNLVTNLNADFLDGLNSTSYFRADAGNSVDVRLTQGDGRGLRFWEADAYKIYMSASSNTTWGGRVAGDSTSDYNFYFRIGGGGTNRGFVFQNGSSSVGGIDGSGNIRCIGHIDAGTQFLGSTADTSNAPGYSWDGDTDVGMYHPATDTIGFTTGGVERLRITSGGSVGVGTTSVSARLHIVGGTSFGSETSTRIDHNTCQLQLVSRDANPCYVGTTTSHAFGLVTNNAFRLSVDASGNVGIGNTTPSNLFIVQNLTQRTDTITATLPVTFVPDMVINRRHGTVSTSGLTYPGPALSFRAFNGSATWDTGTIMGAVDGLNGTNTSGGLFFYTAAGGQPGGYLDGRNAGGAQSLALALGFNQNVYMPGNVGIGQSNPSYRLHVNGDSYINGTLYFPTGGAGLYWGNAFSRIYDDGHLRITTDDNMYITAPLQLLITSPDIQMNGGGRMYQAIGSETAFTVDNTSNSASALSAIRLRTSGNSDFIIFKNSSSRTGDGGACNVTMRNDAGAIRILGSNSSGIMVTNIGNVGIGTETPCDKLSISSPGITDYHGIRFYEAGNSNYGAFVKYHNGDDRITIGTTNLNVDTNAINVARNNGYVGILTAIPSYQLHVTGNIYATQDIYAFSDCNYKENIYPIPNALDKVSQLTGYTYSWKDDSNHKIHAGLLAQEVEKVLPEVINHDQDGKKSVAYGNVVALLIQAMNEQNKKIEDQQQTIESLVKRIEALESSFRK